MARSRCWSPFADPPVKDGREDQMKRQPAFIQVAMRDVAATMSVDLVDTFKFTEASAELNEPISHRAGWRASEPAFLPAGRLEHGHPTHQPARHFAPLAMWAGLSTSAWGRQHHQSRAIWDTFPAIQRVLVGDAVAATQAVNFPVVITSATKDTVLAIGCALTGAGGTGR